MNYHRYKTVGSLLAGGVLMLGIWVLLVFVASRPALKGLIDMTPQRVNSVDPVTVELLQDLRKQGAEIELHLFKLNYGGGQRVADAAAQKSLQIRDRLVELTRLLVRRYVAIGGDSVTFYDHDQYGDVDLFRESAQAFGYTSKDAEALVVAVTMPGRERRFRKLSLVSDLAVIDLPQARGPGASNTPVPVLKDYVGELAISSALKSLLVQGTPVAYLVKTGSRAPTFSVSGNLDYGKFAFALEQAGFEIRYLDFAATPMVPPDADLLAVLEPRREFTQRESDALYAFLKRGGRMFLNYSWSPVPGWNPAGDRLGELLGYTVSTQPVFHLVPDTSGLAGRPIDGVEGVSQLEIRGFSAQHPTTRRLAEGGQPMYLRDARELQSNGIAPPDVTREELLRTGPSAWLARPDREGRPSLQVPAGVELGPKIVAMAFEVARDDKNGAPGRAIVVSGTNCNNLMIDLFGGFALNACNWMVERRVLMDIRGSRYEARSLDVKQPQVDRVKWLLVLWVPLAFAALGFLVWFVRRR